MTPDSIFTSNVGDCRAVLCRKTSVSSSSRVMMKESELENMFENMSLSSNVDCSATEITLNAIALSRDHKAGEIASETERVERAGAKIVNGELRLPCSTNAYVGFTRAYGDFTYVLFEFVKHWAQHQVLKIHLPPTHRYKTDECPALIAEPEVKLTRRNPDSDLFLVLACDGVWDVMTNQQCVNFVHRALKSTSDLNELCSKLIFRCLEKGSTDNMSCIIILFGCGDSESPSVGMASLDSQSTPGGSTESPTNSRVRKSLF